MRGSEIRNPRAYLRGILKGSGGRYGLPHGVQVPPSINQSMLEDRDLIDVLKNMSVRDINSCFRDYDEQIRKKSGIIRNKTAYLMGIIRSGPHYSLPQGVVLPQTLSLAMLQGELLETIQRLPAAHINVAFSEYDEQIQKKGDTIRNRPGYLLGIIKRMKRRFEEEAAEHMASQRQSASQHPISATSGGQSLYQSMNEGGRNEATSIPRELTLKPGETQDTLNLVTESFVKVTNELVTERKARNDLEEQMKTEQSRREETNQRVLKLMSDLAAEKETKERSVMEVERLKKDLAFERSLRETAEEKARMLEENRETTEQQQRDSEPDVDQLKKLELELSIERGLREKTEKLLRTAENRIDELNRELQYTQEKLHEERVQSPFANWMASSPITTSNNQDGGEDKKDPDLPPSLSGFPELVSLTDFDPSTFNFSAAEDSRIIKNFHNLEDRLASELSFVSSAYKEDEIRVNQGEIIRFLRLDVGQTSETVRANLRLRIPSGYPDQGTVEIDAAVADDSTCSEISRTFAAESLPSLVEACRSEAQECTGSERSAACSTDNRGLLGAD
jgi:hypothetical protein